jgi:hypothetical protein
VNKCCAVWRFAQRSGYKQNRFGDACNAAIIGRWVTGVYGTQIALRANQKAATQVKRDGLIMKWCRGGCPQPHAI